MSIICATGKERDSRCRLFDARKAESATVSSADHMERIVGPDCDPKVSRSSMWRSGSGGCTKDPWAEYSSTKQRLTRNNAAQPHLA
jgi:hypothetical protein